jgi:curved DNA-binding protein CbpA
VGGTGGLFKTIQEAYEVLIDPVRRTAYDNQLAWGRPEESVASDGESRTRGSRRGRPSSGGARGSNAYSGIGKPRFRIEPSSVTGADIDSRYPVARVGLRLVQVSGRPYDVHHYVIDFTFQIGSPVEHQNSVVGQQYRGNARDT